MRFWVHAHSCKTAENAAYTASQLIQACSKAHAAYQITTVPCLGAAPTGNSPAVAPPGVPPTLHQAHDGSGVARRTSRAGAISTPGRVRGFT